MRVHRGAQRAGPFAMDDPNAEQAAPPAFGEIVVEQRRDLGRPERMKVQFTRDGNRDWFVGIVRRHVVRFGTGRGQATKNPPSAGAGFCTL